MSNMTRAEEAALKAYPNILFLFTPLDLNAYRRGAFIQGYEQAEKDIYKEIKDRMTEIREKQTKAALEDLNYTIKIDPPLGFDEGSAVIYKGKKLISVLTWEDVQLLDHFVLELVREEKEGKDWGDGKEFYTEVLTRFKQFKEKKK